MAFQLLFSTYDFTDEVLPDGLSLDDPTDIPTEKVPRRQGLYVNETPTRGPRRIHLNGVIQETTTALARARLDTLLKTLNSGLQNLYCNGSSGRYIACYKEDVPRFSFTTNPQMTVVDYSVDFLAVDPFFYDATQTSTTITTSYAGWTHSNGGDELVYPVIQITAAGGGAFSAATLTNSTTGKSFTYAGSVSAGNVLEVDCANFTCENPNGTSDMANFSGTFLWLVAGNNSLALTYTGTAPASVNIAYNKRYDAPAWD